MFEDPSSAKDQIRKDKHAMLEGYVTEYLYENQFLAQFPEKYTHGWWSASRFDQRFFFVVKEALNNLDRTIMKKLSEQGYSCWWAYPQGNAWYFKHGDCSLSEREFLDKYHLRAKGTAGYAASQSRDPDRQTRCIDFFERHQLLQQIATERYFADNFLTVYFETLVNVDFFKETDDGQLKAIEVKFKFEARNRKFGINLGQYQLFELLGQAGISVEHWILYNSSHNSSLSIFGFLEGDMEKYWISGAVDTKGRRRQQVAPKETSVYGKRTQGYYELDMSEFPDKTALRLPPGE